MPCDSQLSKKIPNVVLAIGVLVLCLLTARRQALGQEISHGDVETFRQQARNAIERNDLPALQAALADLPMNDRLGYLDSLIELRMRDRNDRMGHSAGAIGQQQFPREGGFQRAGFGTSSTSGVSSSENSLGTNGGDTTGPPSGAQGGVSRADFTELIELIQNTIAGRWEEQTDTIEPFPSGVWIDASGAIKYTTSSSIRKRLRDPLESSPILVPGLGAFQEWSEMRWVSLHALDRELENRIGTDRPTSVSMELLGGLSRIDAVAFDEATREWFIGGPAGGLALSPQGELTCPNTKLPPVLLEDLLCLAPHVLDNRGVVGCSIDPVTQNLGEAIHFINAPESQKQLARDPKGWTTKLLNIIGPQEVQILGLPGESPTGTAMLIADHHLKRLGLGLEKGPAGLYDYFVEATNLGSVPAQGLIRWWFTINPGIIETDADRTMFVLPSDPVQLLSEQQWSDQRGNRRASGQQDLAADRFAANFTKRFDQVAEMYPIYGRLRHIFSLAIALEIVRRESDGKDSPPFRILNAPEFAPSLPQSPKSIDPVSTTRVLPDRRVVAIVSGGVKLDLVKIGEATRTRSRLPYQMKPTSEGKRSADNWWR